jgi:DNA repair photolyase
MSKPRSKAAFTDTYQQLFESEPPTSVEWGESNADIITQARGFIGAFDLTMQLQVGCPGGCLFCYVPSTRFLTPESIRGPQGETWGFRIRNKRDVLAKFQQYLDAGELADKTIYWSGVTDPYAAPPPLTRGLWQALIEAPQELRPRRLVVQSRFRPDRDAELMADYAQSTSPADNGPAVLISYSIGTDRDDLIRAWERATPSFDQRMKTISRLRQQGLFVVATLSPCGVWNNLSGTLEQFKAWDVAYVTCLFFKENSFASTTPPRFLAYLRQEYPFLLDAAWQRERIREMRAVYGRRKVLVGRNGFTSLVRPHAIVRLAETAH